MSKLVVANDTLKIYDNLNISKKLEISGGLIMLCYDGESKKIFPLS